MLTQGHTLAPAQASRPEHTSCGQTITWARLAEGGVSCRVRVFLRAGVQAGGGCKPRHAPERRCLAGLRKSVLQWRLRNASPESRSWSSGGAWDRADSRLRRGGDGVASLQADLCMSSAPGSRSFPASLGAG